MKEGKVVLPDYTRCSRTSSNQSIPVFLLSWYKHARDHHVLVANLRISPASLAILVPLLGQETDAALRTVTSSLEEKSGGRFLLLWTGDFHDAACGRRCVLNDTHMLSCILPRRVCGRKVLSSFTVEGVRSAVEFGVCVCTQSV